MRLIVGLGPIGGNVGANLAQRGHDVYGYDFDSERVREWSTETTSPAGSDLPAVDWSTIESVHIAVRLADQVTSVFTALKEQTSEPLTVYVHTTLAPTDARNIMGSAPTGWRVFEAPVSGGPQGARNGTMTVFLAGPSGQSADDALLDACTVRRLPRARAVVEASVQIGTWMLEHATDADVPGVMGRVAALVSEAP